MGAAKTVFVLTAKLTFSGSEEFTYNLKNLKRATIIGETTGGGAHPVSGHRIEDHFTIGVPVGPGLCNVGRSSSRVERHLPSANADQPVDRLQQQVEGENGEAGKRAFRVARNF